MKKAQKIKVPPISPERKALFDEAGIKEYDQVTLHRSLYENPLAKIKKRAKEIGVKFVDLEVTGNEIIKRYIQIEREALQKMAGMAWARMKWSEYFYHTFGRLLSDFWEGNALGLDVVKLDDVLVQAPDGVSTKDAILAQHGPVAVQMIEELLHGIEAPAQPYPVPQQEEATT